jgi:alpha-L-fucosidase
MLIKKLLVSTLFFTLLASSIKAQSKINADSIRLKMQWFADAKLGIFIHWGIYAVKGVDESWSFYNKKIGYKEYMDQLKGFTASKYKPEEWAALINESGAKYAVLTTKHHDGVALWPTKQHHYNVVENTPAKRDLLMPFYKALDKYGIKRGAYFSILDWSHPDYTGFMKDSSRYNAKDDPARFKKFQTFFQNQIDEINVAYKPDLWWFDGDWEHSAEEWESEKVRNMILAKKPSAIINGRLQGYGDYETPEQNFPVTRPAFNWWELCMTSNNNWGYQPQDTIYKTPFEIITIYVDAVSNGGNLLLDIGPKEDGTIPPAQVNILKELGAFNKKFGEAIFNTLGGLPQGHYYGPSTLSKDSSTIYLFVPGSLEGPIMLKGLNNSIKKVRLVGSDKTLTPKVVGKISWSQVPGLVYIDMPVNTKEKYFNVVAVELDKPVSLYRGKGGL